VLRVVLDTSSVVSYVLTQGELMERVIAHWRAGTFTVISSPATRVELAAVLARPRIRQRSEVDLDRLVEGLGRFSERVAGTLTVSGICRDPKDDMFLACALEGDAHYLLTSDRDLLDLRHHQDVAIVNPGQLLVAIELFGLTAAEMAERFDRNTLVDIQTVIPLEPATGRRLATALALADTPP
jgi:uncharacterized protein